MDEQEIYAGLGVEPPEDAAGAAGAETEPQDTAAQTEAATGEQTAQETSGDDQTGAEAKPEDPQGAGEQTAEDSREAQALAQAEERGAAREREKNEAAWSAFFSRAGLRDAEGKEIKDLAGFEAWAKAQSVERLREELAEGKLTPEALEDAVRAVLGEDTQRQQAAEAEQQRQQAADARRQAEAEERIKADLAEIGKLDPTIKTLEDIMRSQQGERIYKMVQAGAGIADAWKAANLDRLLAQTAEAARRQTAAARQETAHVGAGARQIGAGAVEVPPATRTLYRELMPGISDAEIRAHYNKERGGN